MLKCERVLGAGCWVLGCGWLLAGCTQYPAGGNWRLHQDMGTQAHYRPQRDPRLPAPGSVPRATPAPDTQHPAPFLFSAYCSPCHGSRGSGDGPVAAKIAKPANLVSARYLARDDEFFYQTITAGSGLMPPQAESLAPAERRAVVAYLRKLQRP